MNGSGAGFGEHKADAVALLRKLARLLNAHAIPFCLISGTLLGHVRHGGDFIPWDDDMDLLVSPRFVEALNELKEEAVEAPPTTTVLNFRAAQITTVEAGWMYKFSFCDGLPIGSCGSKTTAATQHAYRWPYVDLFVYDEDAATNTIHFFGKSWPRDAFFPLQPAVFSGVKVNIPNQPDVFLRANYGSQYMHRFVMPSWNHRTERPGATTQVTTTTTKKKGEEKKE